MLPRLRKNRTRPPFALSVEDLGAVAAVEQHRVVAVLAFDHVAAVAGIPLERVVAGAQERRRRCPAGRRRSRCRRHRSTGRRRCCRAGCRCRRPPSTVMATQRGQVAGGGERVVAAVGVEHQLLGACPCRRRTAPGRGGRSARACRSAVAVNCSVPPPPLTIVVSMPAPPSLRSVSSPGFQIMASSPPSPNAWSSASPPVRVSLSQPAEQAVEAALGVHRVVAALTDQQVVGRPAGQRVVAGAADDGRLRQRAVRLVESEVVASTQAEQRDRPRVGDRRCAAEHRHRPAVDEDRPGGVPRDRDHVVLAAADHGQRRRGRRAPSGRWPRGRGRCCSSPSADAPALARPPMMSDPTLRRRPLLRGVATMTPVCRAVRGSDRSVAGVRRVMAGGSADRTVSGSPRRSASKAGGGSAPMGGHANRAPRDR